MGIETEIEVELDFEIEMGDLGSSLMGLVCSGLGRAEVLGFIKFMESELSASGLCSLFQGP